MKQKKGVPLGLLERLVVREILLIGREPLIGGKRQDGRHLALVEPWLDGGLEALVEHQDVAVRLLKEVELALGRVAGRDEESLEASLDGA